MLKCDFCEYSGPDGKCFWSKEARLTSCRVAIDRMEKALKNLNKEDSKKHKRW